MGFGGENSVQEAVMQISTMIVPMFRRQVPVKVPVKGPVKVKVPMVLKGAVLVKRAVAVPATEPKLIGPST